MAELPEARTCNYPEPDTHDPYDMLPISEFYVFVNKWGDLTANSYCKSCFSKQVTKRRRIKKFSQIPDRYNPDECAICNATIEVVIDHSHDCGHIRGPLCNLHNRAIGMFHDDIGLLEKAIAYIKEHRDECDSMAPITQTCTNCGLTKPANKFRPLSTKCRICSPNGNPSGM